MELFKETEFIILRMEENIKENGLMEKCMGMGNYFILMEGCIKDNLKMM